MVQTGEHRAIKSKGSCLLVRRPQQLLLLSIGHIVSLVDFCVAMGKQMQVNKVPKVHDPTRCSLV